MYKVLWFDDEHKTLELIKEEAVIADIQLVGFSDASNGLKELQESYKEYHAVLLDGLFFKNDSETGDVQSGEAFGEVARVLSNFKSRGIIIPWFIYSGQKSFVKDRNVLVDVFSDAAFANGKIFDKNKDEDFVELCNEIKKEADKLPTTIAKNNNPEIFEIFELGYLPEAVEDNVLDLLIKPLPQNNSELKAILTNIRSIQESCFISLNSLNVVPNPEDSFNNIIKHLSGNKVWNSTIRKLEPKSTEYQNAAIENLHKWIYFTCGNYIHYLKQEHHDGYMISNYAVESLRNGLLEILLWFKKTYEENI
ncbi:MAG: hypothetical protein ACSHXA_09940 [Polaribacter sp.]|uniref:hypothetical protein n=1 Tax=Polaribacter sp. TaxID=1920175 RepID=UPI003EF5E886